MTVSFTRTREQLAGLVLGKLRVVGAGVTVASVDAELVYEAIDLRLKELHRLGTFWRKIDSVPFTFSAAATINTASATADIVFPIQLTISNNGVDDPVTLISPLEYAAISNKTETGLPLKAVWNRGTEFRLWPVPTANATLKLVYERLATDTTAGAAADVEVSMIRWLKDIVAYDCADNFNVEEPRMARLERESRQAELNIRKLNALAVDLTTVVVDDYDTQSSGVKRDWNTG